MYTYQIVYKLTRWVYSSMGHKKILDVLKSAWLIKLPELKGLKKDNSVAPINQSVEWIAPFHLATCNAISEFLDIPKLVDCELVCDTEGNFELLFNPEQEDPDLTMLMFLAVEATEMLLKDCEVKNEIVDISKITNGFTPQLFGMEKGEIFDSSLLKNGLMINVLSETGVFTASNVFDMIKEQSAEVTPSPIKAF
jgi:hypothetical protein